MSLSYPVASQDYKSAAWSGYLVIIICFGGLFGWSSFSQIDSAISAPASILVESRRQIVQHLEGGILREILVREGDFVKQGQILFRLDDTTTKANLELTRNQLTLAMAQEARYLAERDSLPAIAFNDELLNNSENPTVAQIMADQESIFKQRHASIDSQLSILKSRQVTLKDEIDGLRTERQAANTQLFYINDELKGVRELAEKGLVAVTRLNSLEREKARLDGVIGRSEIDESKALNNINEADLQVNQIMQKYFEDNASGLQDVRAKIADLKEKIRVYEDGLRRVQITAPRDGTVQTDVNSVTIGQRVELRFPSFHSRLTPVMFGNVKSLSHDQLINEANRQPYFLAQISIEDADIPDEIKSKLSAGMPGEAVFSTGTRTVLQYVMSPLTEAFRHAWREK